MGGNSESACDILPHRGKFQLSSTISVATGIVSGVGTFFIGLVFACYILLQQEFLKRQMKKLIFAYLKESTQTVFCKSAR